VSGGESIRYDISLAEFLHSDADRGKVVSSAGVGHVSPAAMSGFGLWPSGVRAEKVLLE
jgi:hypothetical protein